MDQLDTKQIQNRKLTSEERNDLMSSPDLNSSDFNNDESQSSTTNLHTSESNDVSTEKNVLTGSTFFRSLAGFLQTHNSSVSNTNLNDKLIQQPINTSSEYSQKNINNLLLNLEIISKIKENDKLSNQENILEIDNRIGKFIRRWFTGDSRNQTLKQIEDIVDSTMDITEQLLEIAYDDNNKTFDEKQKLIRSFGTNISEYFQKFSQKMKSAIEGLINLKKTYDNDIAIKARIDGIIDKLTQRQSRITETLDIKTKLK